MRAIFFRDHEISRLRPAAAPSPGHHWPHSSLLSGFVDVVTTSQVE
jgi:hypothetical protein